jgi:hypothetical protein
LYKAGDLEQRAAERPDRLKVSEEGENHAPDHNKRRYACISGSGLYDKRKVVAQSEDWPKAVHPLAETRNCAMSSDQNSLTQPEERVETRSLRTVTTLDRMTEPIAKELNECLCVIVVNASTCLRMLAAESPNVEGARETARRTIRDSKRAAEAVSRLSSLFTEKK